MSKGKCRNSINRNQGNTAPNKTVIGASGLRPLIGISTTKSSREIATKCLEKGLIVLTAHDKVRLLPPLTISKEEMNTALKILNEVISE